MRVFQPILPAILGFGLLLSAPALYAQTNPAASPIASPITALDAALIQAMKTGPTTPFEQRVQALTPVVERAFDLQTVLQTAVGLRWSQLPPDQQQALLAAFTRFTVASYAANFNKFSGEHFDLAGTSPAGNEQVVQTRLVPVNGEPTKLNYVMRQENGQWRAVDVLLDGSISRAAVMRSDFRSLLSDGNAQRLIQNLQQKTASLAAGTQP